MKFEEALKLMREGKKFKGHWNTGEYFYIDKDGTFLFFNNADGKVHSGVDFLNAYDFSPYCDWEEFKEPILDKEEKAYLEAVLKPFKGRVKLIEHIKAANDKFEYIYAIVNDGDVWPFPYFKTGSMYKGMKLFKPYTLKELGLFEDDK